MQKALIPSVAATFERQYLRFVGSLIRNAEAIRTGLLTLLALLLAQAGRDDLRWRRLRRFLTEF